MAEVSWIYAPIGGGKTFYAVRELCGELRRTERQCVFGLPVILNETCKPDSRYFTLQEWCDKFIEKPVNVFTRCFFLTAEQQREWYRYLPFDGVEQWQIEKYKLEVVINEIEGLGKSVGIRMPMSRVNPIGQSLCDFSFRESPENTRYYHRGCYYQLDECHKSFPARMWQLLGPAAEDYTSETRKFNDDLDFITQHPEKVDKNLRRNATQWIQVVNMERNRLFMGVTFNKKFRYYLYPQPEMPSKNDKPESSVFFHRGGKEKIEFVYKTMWGQSVRGGGTSETNKRKGLHWSVWIVALVAMFAFGHYFPLIIENAIAKGVGGTLRGVQKGMQRGVVPSMPATPVVQTNLAPARVVNSTIVESLPVAAAEPRGLPAVPPGHAGSPSRPQTGVYCTGWAYVNGTNDLRVFLSDGRMAYSSRGEVQGIGLRYVRVFGEDPISIR